MDALAPFACDPTFSGGVERRVFISNLAQLLGENDVYVQGYAN